MVNRRPNNYIQLVQRLSIPLKRCRSSRCQTRQTLTSAWQGWQPQQRQKRHEHWLNWPHGRVRCDEYITTSSTKDDNAKSDRIEDYDDDPDLSHDCHCRSDHWPISPALLLRLLFLLLPSWMTLSNRSSSNSSFFSRNFLCPTVYWVISKGGLAYDYVGSPTSRGSPNNTFDFLLLSSCSHLSSICYDIIPPLFTAIQFIRSLLT